MKAALCDGANGMVFLDWKELPWQWWNSDQFWWCALLVVVVPALLAYVFGYLAFRSRVKGVYFSIITQALTFAAMLLFFRNDTGFGGNNGFTDFKRVLGIPITTLETRVALFAITGAMYETNAALSFDRKRAYGCRLNIAAGTAVRFEPGQARTVELIEIAGDCRIFGFRGLVMGPLGEHRP